MPGHDSGPTIHGVSDGAVRAPQAPAAAAFREGRFLLLLLGCARRRRAARSRRSGTKIRRRRVHVSRRSLHLRSRARCAARDRRQVCVYCERSGIRGRTVTRKVKVANFRLITRSRTGQMQIGTRSELEQLGDALLEPLFPVAKGIRLLGISLSALAAEETEGSANSACPFRPDGTRLSSGQWTTPAPGNAAPVSRFRFGAYALVQTLTVFIAVSASVLVL
jgi:hypothetical protein